jgi:hypothetical protein
MNRKFGKIENNRLVYAPSVIIDGDKQIITTDAAIYLQYGYKEIMREPYPQGTEIVYKESYVESDTTITISWVEDLEATRQSVLGKIAEFDTSDAVNGFTLGNVETWLNRDDRVCLMHSLEVSQLKGETTYGLCVEGVGVVTLPILTIKSMLDDIEYYAIQCYKRTFEHKEAVNALTTCEELVNYNYTEGYPEKLHFDI